jgi:hypothetical protein
LTTPYSVWKNQAKISPAKDSGSAQGSSSASRTGQRRLNGRLASIARPRPTTSAPGTVISVISSVFLAAFQKSLSAAPARSSPADELRRVAAARQAQVEEAVPDQLADRVDDDQRQQREGRRQQQHAQRLLAGVAQAVEQGHATPSP